MRGTTGSSLLDDPVRGVRIEAARALLGQSDLLEYDEARALATATAEYREKTNALLGRITPPQQATGQG